MVFGSAAHEAQHQARKQHEAGEGDAQEREHAGENFGSRALRRPGEADDGIVPGVGDVEDVVAGWRDTRADHAKVRQSDLMAHGAEQRVLEEADGHHHRCRRVHRGAVGCGDRKRGHEREPAQEHLHHHRVGDGRDRRVRPTSDQAHHPVGDGDVAAQVVDQRLEKDKRLGRHAGVVVLPADLPVHELIRGADHPHQVVVAHRVEPAREPRRGQRGGSFEIEAADRIVRRDDVAQSANRPLAVVDDGAGEQVLFVFERDLVGAIGGCQRRDDDADDRHRDDDAKRHDNAQARAIPHRGLLIVPRLSQSPGLRNRNALLRTRPTRDGRWQCLLIA